MHGVHNNNGHHHTHGPHGAGTHGKHDAAPASAPAAQQPSMDSAMAALDQAIKGLAANFHKDSFNGQQAPADVAQPASTLTNSVGSRNSDLFLNSTGASAAPAPASAPVAQQAP